VCRLREPRLSTQLSLALLAVLLLGRCAAAGTPDEQAVPAVPVSPVAVTDLPSLSDELRRISANLGKDAPPEKVQALRNSLPDQWSIKTPERDYSISTDYLRRQLSDKSPTNAKLWVDNLQNKLSTYSQTGNLDLASSRAQLDHILAAQEFAAVHPPTSWDLFRRRVALWFARLLGRIFGGLYRYPIGGQILFWLILIAGVGFIALTIFRFLIGRDRIDSIKSEKIIVASRTWQEWVRLARDAAARNDFREAIHSIYWAGITRLEDAGALPMDHSRTPREYLSLVSQPTLPEQPSNTAFREPLSILTRRLEQIWYGRRNAAPEDFRDSLRQLELLGCQLE